MFGDCVVGCSKWVECLFFFFQAEDGIRDWSVTGVQTCALPISRRFAVARDRADGKLAAGWQPPDWQTSKARVRNQIGRASCRERV